MTVIAEFEKKMQAGFDGVATKYDQVIASVQKGETVTNELKSEVENAKGELQKVIDQIRDLEEKGGLQPEEKKQASILNLVGENASYKSFRERGCQSGSVDIEIKGDDYKAVERKALVMARTSNLIIPTYDPTIHEQPRSEFMIRNLIPSIPVTSPQFTYFKQKARAVQAGMVAEGAAKPQGAVEFESVTDRVKKMAEWIPITEEAAADIPQLVGYIENLLAYDLRYTEELQIIKGDGTGENLDGLMTQATAYDPTAMRAAASDTPLDKIRRMIAQVRIQSKRGADFITMSELDWLSIELLKDSDGAYLFAAIQGLTTPLLWGRPVSVSDAMDDATGEVLVGHARGALIYDREALRIEIGRINDDFIKNQFVILAEKRLGLAVRDPNAFVKSNLVEADAGG